VEKGHAMVELHSNFNERGNTTSTDGTIPTNHQLHETLEITHGFTNWFETAGGEGKLRLYEKKSRVESNITEYSDRHRICIALPNNNSRFSR